MIKLQDVFDLLGVKRLHQQWIIVNLKNEFTFQEMSIMLTNKLNKDDEDEQAGIGHINPQLIELVDTVNTISTIDRLRNVII